MEPQVYRFFENKRPKITVIPKHVRIGVQTIVFIFGGILFAWGMFFILTF